MVFVLFWKLYISLYDQFFSNLNIYIYIPSPESYWKLFPISSTFKDKIVYRAMSVYYLRVINEVRHDGFTSDDTTILRLLLSYKYTLIKTLTTMCLLLFEKLNVY